jgi:hypothetical protein
VSAVAERGTRKPGDLRKPDGKIVTDEELASLSDHELVTLIILRSNLDEEAAREALAIRRGGPPNGYAFERMPKTE